MPRIRASLIAVAFALGAATGARAAAADEAPSRIPSVTRLVKLFLEREAALGDAIRAGDATALERLLADDFELRVGTRPGRPIPRGDFVRSLMQARDPGGAISAMAVHDLGGAMIVSYAQGNRGGQLFVVDVWRAHDGDWRLAVRYASSARDANTAIPGAIAVEPEIPKKY